MNGSGKYAGSNENADVACPGQLGSVTEAGAIHAAKPGSIRVTRIGASCATRLGLLIEADILNTMQVGSSMVVSLKKSQAIIEAKVGHVKQSESLIEIAEVRVKRAQSIWEVREGHTK